MSCTRRPQRGRLDRDVDVVCDMYQNDRPLTHIQQYLSRKGYSHAIRNRVFDDLLVAELRKLRTEDGKRSIQ